MDSTPIGRDEALAANPGAVEYPERFSLVVGGPFHVLLGRLGLVAPDLLPTLRAALGLAFVAWAIPCGVAVVQTLLDPDYKGGLGIFTDITVYCRYLVAIALMLMTERIADNRVRLLIRQFYSANMLAAHGRAPFNAAVNRADHRSSSAIAEAMILGLAFAGSVASFRLSSTLVESGWEGHMVGGEVGLSWAGAAAAMLSNPLFLFLAFRWIWRFLVWAALLFRVSRLPLQIMPLHPDRAGGLAFLAIFPSIFSGFALALSCVVASAMFKAAQVLEHTEETVWIAIAVWIGFIGLLFLGPLLVFVRPLYRARELAVLDYGRLAHLHHLAFHAKWIAGAGEGRELMGSADPSSVSDLNASVAAALDMRIMPMDRAALLQLLAAAGLPFLVFLASQMPLDRLLGLLLGTIL